jgi:uncharacterized membrane protein YccC
MQRFFVLYFCLGIVLLALALAFGVFQPQMLLAAGFAVAGGLVLLGGAFVIQRSQVDEALLRTMERRVFDLESELEARAGERALPDD